MRRTRDIAAEVRETLYYERGIGHPPARQKRKHPLQVFRERQKRRAEAQEKAAEGSRKLRREERLRNKEAYERIHGPSKWDK